MDYSKDEVWDEVSGLKSARSNRFYANHDTLNPDFALKNKTFEFLIKEENIEKYKIFCLTGYQMMNFREFSKTKKILEEL